MFGGTSGNVHMTKEGVEFVYINHGSKAFERLNISPAHTHMVIPMERKAPIPPQRLAPQPILGMPVQTTPLQQLLTVYFGTPSMFNTLWFGFDYGTNPPLGTLII
jgi:hypothetical protein